jgi:hypothetical protein
MKPTPATEKTPTPSVPPFASTLPFVPVVLIAAPLALLVTSCKPNISDANIEAVNQRYVKADLQERGSLSPKEVESILGQPDQIESTTIELETQKKQVPVTRFIYQQNGKQIELHFIDNKLIDKIQPWKNPTPPDSNQP